MKQRNRGGADKGEDDVATSGARGKDVGDRAMGEGDGAGGGGRGGGGGGGGTNTSEQRREAGSEIKEDGAG